MTFKSGEIFAENYLLIKRLGAGSFGEVWLAKNMMADINVAIKFYSGLDRNGINDFKEEFKLAYRLSHPNLLHMNHFDVYNQCPYLVMPYCPNGSANQLRGNVSETRIWEFIRDVSAGLAYLHAQNPPIIHQDIKLGNILIDENGRFIVTDFGISKKIEFHMQTLRNVKMESSGTIAYMSPERLNKPPTTVMASDMWSVGICVYELVTGQVLWEFGGAMQLGGADIPSLGGNYSSQLSQFFQRCLSQNPWERPKAQEAYEEAKAKLSGKIYSSQPITHNSIPPHPPTSVHNLSNPYRRNSNQPISHSAKQRTSVKKHEPTLWEKYGDIIKWGGGAILLFVVALGGFSLLIPKKETPTSFPKKDNPVIVEPVNPIETETIPAIIPNANPKTDPSANKPNNPKAKPYYPTPTPKPVVVDKEEDFWKKCKSQNNVFMYNRYLNEYPKGKHVIEARKKIQELERMDSRTVLY